MATTTHPVPIQENEAELSGLQGPGLQQQVDLEYLEAPPKFSFENKLSVARDISNISGIENTVGGDDASSVATPLENAFGDRSWSWLSANSGPNSTQKPPTQTKIQNGFAIPNPPDFMDRGDGVGPIIREEKNVGKEPRIDVNSYADKVPPELWAQMKKLEALQNPFSETKAVSPKPIDATRARVAAAMKRLESLQDPLGDSGTSVRNMEDRTSVNPEGNIGFTGDFERALPDFDRAKFNEQQALEKRHQDLNSQEACSIQ